MYIFTLHSAIAVCYITSVQFYLSRTGIIRMILIYQQYLSATHFTVETFLYI